MRLHRMISILLLVEARDKIKAKELAEEFETSVRTIYRDIDTLCESGIPLTTDTGPNGGIHFVDGYTVGIKNLQREDIINLYLNCIGIKADKQSDLNIKFNTALIKFKKNLSSNLNYEINSIKNKFYVDDTSWWDKSPKLHNIDIFIQSVWLSQKLKITYEKHNGDITQRNIQPYGIVVKKNTWYLIAYCEKSKAIRTFKCTRITECHCMTQNFIIPEEFSIEQYWKKSKQLFKNKCSENEKYPVVIRINKNRTDILNNFEIYKIKEAEYYIDATINMYKYEYAIYDILDIISYAEILEPQELRDYAKGKLYTMLENYNR